MLDDKQKLVEDAPRGDTELAGGFIDREYKKVCAALEKVQESIPTIKYPILNFFRGAVTTDRLHHETAARNGGLQHWCNNASAQGHQDNRFLRNTLVDHPDYDQHVPQTANVYAAADRSTGMGLESENLQSFITGTQFKVVPAVSAKSSDNVFPVQSDSVAPVQTPQPVADEHIQAAPLTLARGPLYRYRSKASVTYTDLPALAANQ
jgi:hypothetical protein